ncbi:glycosyltransferase [Dysgonomonas sp. 216]|uniref:glycosyltransferase n=1 Tax=Dysgonomonas sp. 216 TaxID=2302934 RepID=UPI0013CF4BD2|nr:glycosyltransferase [Dysgonomonas sp. 216]NDW17509.1 glycosyltransferase [Dysgonomonas sp. 216]
MKIAILSPFYPFRGGLAQLNARLYTELSKNNEVKAFTFTTLYPDLLFPGKTQFVTEDDTATVIDSIRILSSINPFTYIKTAKAINKYSPDILIIPYWMSFFAPAYGTVCRFINKKTKVISLVHNAISHERVFMEKQLAKYFLKRCDAFLVMSEPVKKDLQTLCSHTPILQLPHPIYDHYKETFDREEACKQLDIKPDKKNLLFFGFIRDYKGLDLLIEATNHLTDEYQLIIAGESYGSFDKYAQLIEKSKLKDNIIVFEQYINDDMVTTLFSAADVLVLPYRSATQSGVVALAYQLETPMVATNVGALGETVREANTGIVVENPNPEEIANGIIEFFESNKQAEFIDNILSEKERLSWKTFTSKVEAFISEPKK